MMKMPVGGVIQTQSNINGGSPDSARLVCVVSGTDYGTQWCPYVGDEPSNPGWLDPVPASGQTVNANQVWNVIFKADSPATAPEPLKPVRVTGKKKTRMVVSYKLQ